MGNAKTQNDNNSVFAAAAIKKTVVEQFKSFSVYEDQTDESQQAYHHFAASSASISLANGKENIYFDQQNHPNKNEYKQ